MPTPHTTGLEQDTDPIDPELTAEAAREADPAVLGAMLAHLTGDLAWAQDPALAALRGGGTQARGEAPLGYLAAASAMLGRLARQGPLTPPTRDDETLLLIARAALHDGLTAEDVPRLRHHLWPESSIPAIDPADAVRSGLRVTVVGAGMSGLGLAVQLAAAGIDYTVLERRDAVGGVWYDNSYPDAGVDTQAFQYAWELAPQAGWTRYDTKRDELLAYIRRTADKSGVLDHVRCSVEVLEAAWDEHRATWVLTVEEQGTRTTIETDVLISAVGALNRPSIPAIPGLEDFTGPAFHTAEWDAEVDLTDRRVALIGNGSSGTQVGRAIAERARSLTAFQRTPHWIRPRGRGEAGAVGAGLAWLVEKLPSFLGWYRFYLNFVLGDGEHPKMVRQVGEHGLVPTTANDEVRAELTAYLQAQLRDREDLVKKLTPDYPPYGKRLVIDNGWYATLTRPHVRLVTEPVERVTATGIRTADGEHHEAEVIVFATGFHGTRYFWPMEIVGRSGRALAETHGGEENIRAHLGVVMPGYPNFFALQGPNSSVGHGGGVTFMSECQSRYILDCLRLMISGQLRTMEIRREVCEAYNAEMDAELDRMVWSAEGLHSRYRNNAGRIVMNHPWTIARFFDLTRRADPADFVTSPGR